MPRGIGSPVALRMARTRIMEKSGIGPRAFSCGREAIESVREMEVGWDTVNASNSNCGMTRTVGARSPTRSWRAMAQKPYE